MRFRLEAPERWSDVLPRANYNDHHRSRSMPFEAVGAFAHVCALASLEREPTRSNDMMGSIATPFTPIVLQGTERKILDLRIAVRVKRPKLRQPNLRLNVL